MAVEPVTAELLTLNTLSTDFPTAGSGSLNNLAASVQGDGWEIQPPAGQTLGERLIIRLFDGSATATVTFKAGDRYPAQRADLGDMDVALSADDVKYITIETSRFLQDDGKIIVISSDAGTILTAMIVPKAG